MEVLQAIRDIVLIVAGIAVVIASIITVRVMLKLQPTLQRLEGVANAIKAAYNIISVAVPPPVKAGVRAAQWVAKLFGHLRPWKAR